MLAKQAQPESAFGADLVWWRTTAGMRTTVTVLLDEFRSHAAGDFLQAKLFDPAGVAIADWQTPIEPGKPVFIDSGAAGPWRDLVRCDGILALSAYTPEHADARGLKRYQRLFPIVDWHSPDGRVATLHSDQVVRRGESKQQELTEIVVIETDEERNSLVFLNGEEVQPAGALEIAVKNLAGVVRSSKYAAVMPPFTVHRIELDSLLPGLAEFSGGAPLLVSGTFASNGLFSRPYVETNGSRWGAYHAGDVYDWEPLPYFAHALISGEVNPVAVWHDEATRTIVNLLHSHGRLEADMPVGVRLYDLDGNCVADHAEWRLAPRHGIARFDVAELLPDPSMEFRGHIALSYLAAPGQAVPRRLQALMEYRRSNSVARTMTWSDEWNSRLRLARRDRSDDPLISRSFFRVREDGEVSTEFSITNAGHAGYDRDADVLLRLLGAGGLAVETRVRLAPFGSCVATIREIFPNALKVLGPSRLGVLVVESRSDLANLAFTQNRNSGALAAEHFLWLWTEQEGKFVLPVGS